jgi:transposase InsO family protein
VQEAFRQVFARWGMPRRLQVDNGVPWGCKGGLPAALALWLVGLGIDVRWSRPAVPQDNGVVERSMRTGKAWANPGKCKDHREVQGRLDEMDRIQREQYPALAGRPRLAVWPELSHSGRAYDGKKWERGNWSLEAALARLGCFVVHRRVSAQGRVSLYDRPYHVGVSLADQEVLVQLSPERVEWIVSDRKDRQVRAIPASTLTRKNIVALLEL